MKDIVDHIKFHGVITNIRDKYDKEYIWFDICQKEIYQDRNGRDRVNLSFFSARLYKEYVYKIELKIGKDVYVQGIPKGYVDKNGHRQNYIHILEINGIDINPNKIISYDHDGVMIWHDERCEQDLATEEEIRKFEEELDNIC